MARRGYEQGGRYSADPIGSDKPRGKATGQRKAGRDGPNWTPTELHRRNQLMRQFMRTGEGGGGNSNAFKDNYADVFGHD